MRMRQLILALVICVSSKGFAQSQTTGASRSSGDVLTLQESIDYALKHNVSLRQSELQVRNSSNTLEQSRWLKYPTLNGSYSLNSNFGRNIDPFSNSIVTQTIGTNSIGVGAGVTIFNGHQIKNTVSLNELNLEASTYDFQAMKNNVTLQVVVAYLNVLSTEDMIEVAQKQLEVTQLQIQRTEKLVKAGAVPETNLYDLQAQLASDELQKVNADNNHESAILTLKQAMNLPAERDVSVVRVNVPNPSIQAYPESAIAIYEAAIAYLPEVKAADTRIKAADKSIMLAKALGLPTISANTSWGTAYSTAAKTATAGEPTVIAIPATATFQGQTVPFTLNYPQPSYTTSGIPYFRQLGNNQNLNLGVALRVPIFNSYQAKYRTTGAKIQKMQSELQSESTKLQIRQSIDQAYITMLNAAKRYTATASQVSILEKSFEAAAARYNAGSANYTDFNLSKTNLDRAKANLVQAKYDYIFRIKILDFYQNKPLDF